MSDKIQLLNKAINRTIKPISCNPACKYWVFSNLKRPCVLSDVYGASARGKPCYDYKLIKGVNYEMDKY